MFAEDMTSSRYEDLHSLFRFLVLTRQQSLEWTFLQTPQFELHSHSSSDDSAVSEAGLSVPNIAMKVRYGAITECRIMLGSRSDNARTLGYDLVGRRLHEITDWDTVLAKTAQTTHQSEHGSAGSWLKKMLPPVSRP